MKTILIKQPAGLGDIFFCQKIGIHYLKQGYRVIWPVLNHFLYIKDYIKNGIEFISDQSQTITSDVILDLCQASRLVGGKILESKYRLANLDFSDWQEYFKFERNTERENNLFHNILKLKDGEDYVLVNHYVASPPTTQFKNFTVNTRHKIVEMSVLPNSHVFDWCKVLEKVKGIYIVDSGINYIIDKLNTTSELVMWSRYTPADFSHIYNLFQKKWRMMTI